jgi:acetyl-CoA carboxylase biotin carboxylase subunit
MFDTVLVANRGEIAVRILRTLRELGIRGVAVYSEADEHALHVLEADAAVCIGSADPRESYLNGAKLVAAACLCGAEAIHPGYGFLSENAVFAQQVEDAGLVFVGPPPSALAAVGDKTAARQRMRAAGVPVIPGMDAPDDDPARLTAVAEGLGWPVLLKAAAGGGGKGMRVVTRREELAEAIARGTSEAERAFGDGRVYLERFLPRARHVEVQILADRHGHVVHLFERECSLQRRHQKIVEESPSPALDPDLRERMGAAAVAAARAAGYVNAGTVEFLLAPDGSFHFLEVNARLQVEHPVTELVTGTDLVRLQLAIAAGAPLPLRQEDLRQTGHAIECRIYAEDPRRGFQPSPGRVVFFRPPEGPGVRFDGGIYAGYEVPVHYDPILGKLVVWAPDRVAAIERMRRALADLIILGVRTPIEFLRDLVGSEAFRRGATHTRLVEESFADWQPARGDDDVALAAWAAETTAGGGAAPAGGAPGGAAAAGEPPSPWQTLGAWDLLPRVGPGERSGGRG